MEQNNLNEQLTRKERREFKRQEKETAKQSARKKRSLQHNVTWALAALLVVGGLGGLVKYAVSQPSIPEGDIISKAGIHWHPELSIYIKGVKQEIPAGIGLGVAEQSLHTHDNTGTLHLEIPGVVRKEDTKLGRFFTIWGKQFTLQCIFDSCTGQNGTLKMLVNGKENTDFGNYEMHDGDKIEIRYE